MQHASAAELDGELDAIRESPPDHGVLALIVARPAVDEREVVDEATLDPSVGLVGDTWATRGSTSTPDGSAHPDKQLTLMNARVIAALAKDAARWALAGDQLYVDLDLSEANLPAGTRLAIGTAVVEITEPPHRGCAKFSARFGVDALRFVNSPAGNELRLRGVNAKVVTAGTIRRGDEITKT